MIVETITFVLLFLVAPCVVCAVPGLALLAYGRRVAGVVCAVLGAAAPIALPMMLIAGIPAEEDLGPTIVVYPLMPWIAAVPTGLIATVACVIVWAASGPRNATTQAEISDA